MPDAPLRIVTCTLATADALAYEQAAHRMSPIGTFALLLWLGLWGAGATLIPLDWSGPRLGWGFPVLVSILIAIGYVLALILIAFRQWLAARARIPRPVEFTFTEWPARLGFDGLGLPSEIVFSDVRRTILTPEHLFLALDSGVAIVPRRAILEPGALDALVSRVAGVLPPQPEAHPSIVVPPQPEAQPAVVAPSPVDPPGASA